MHAPSVLSSAVAEIVPSSSLFAAAASAADRVERMLSVLSGGPLNADVALVLQHSRQFSTMQQCIAELRVERATLRATVKSLEDQIARVKEEKSDALEALIKTTQLKRKGERELDDQRKKLRAAEDELEQKAEQLNQFTCIACMAALASVVYHPCACAPYCVTCDAAYHGGPNPVAAAAGRRSCPKCCAEIVSTAQVRVGH